LANALLDNRSVTHLNLSRNAIAAPGCLVLAEALTGNTHLGALMLHDNPLGAEGGSHLLLAMSTNTTVHHLGLQGCCFVDTPTLPDPGGAPQQVLTFLPNAHV
jgi:Ran GTPase-activating protein (RanGAP) involved in mRNA processing and transport